MSHALFDALQAHFGCTSDAGLEQRLGFGYRCISKYRLGKLRVAPVHILRIYDLAGWSIEHIRALIADATPKVPTAQEIARQATRQAIAAKKAKTIAKKETRQKPRMEYADDNALKRLTIIKTPKWTSTVPRVL